MDGKAIKGKVIVRSNVPNFEGMAYRPMPKVQGKKVPECHDEDCFTPMSTKIRGVGKPR